ncbi:hypothetical protein PM030_12290 [Halorubrum ezzemoulense]|uniref:hypothetical protein n=1 Tax=Halorubrum ezzemoulense TaxID=337243 RepID=UPI00232FB385|nr:hypothetical protein [Halorubrum ezzemoulense]MDB2282651.1 hypothetical protein [Halorubrum ezzemoulense]
MYTYSAYDLLLRSAFELSELPTVEGSTGSPDVEIRRGTVDPVSESVEGTAGRRITATPDSVRLTYDSVGSFLVEDGKQITCDPLGEPASKREFFCRLIENELLGLILYQRDHLVLHASAVSIDGKAAIFLGPRGAGKSTTAAAFNKEGYDIIEDDVVAIRFDDSVPTVVPGVPQLRLKSDAAAALNLKETTTPSEEQWYEKRMLRIEDVPDPAQLGGCYLLMDGEQCALEPMAGSEQILNLISRTYARGLLSDTKQSAANFNQCSRLSKVVPVQKLKRPRVHQQLSSVVNLVIGNIKEPE